MPPGVLAPRSTGSVQGNIRLHPDTFVKLFLTAFPTSEGTELYEMAVRPLADSGSFKEGRIEGMSRIARKGSDWKGNFQGSSVTVQFSDQDGSIRERLRRSSPWQFWLNREAQICSLSPEGRLAGLEPTIDFRGWITDAQVLKGRMASVTISDVLSSQMDRLNLDKKIGILIGSEHGDTLPPESRGRMYPILGGEGTDFGFKDSEGERTDRGVLGVIEVSSVVVPATAPTPTPTPDDPEPAPNTLYTREVEVVAGIVAGGFGNIGEETWFKGYAYKDGHAVTPVAIGQTGVNNPGVFVDAIDVYWNGHTADDTEYFHTGDIDGFWFFRYTGGPNAFDPFDNPNPSGVKVAFLDIPFVEGGTGPYAVPGGGETEFFVRFDSMPGNPWFAPPVETVDPPVLTSGSVVGAVGDVTRYYAATALTGSGETTSSNVLQVDGTPRELTSTNYVEVEGTYELGDQVRLYHGLASSPSELIGQATLTPGDPGTFEFLHTTSSFTSPVAPPSENTAVVTPDGWTRMVVCIGAIAGISRVYGTNRAEDGPPKSVEQAEEWFGPEGELLAPGFPGWPHVESYINVGGIRMTVIYARGEILRSHRANEVGITVNFCGPEEIGDGTGNVIDGALYWLEWFLNEMVLKNNGSGYRDGNWFDPDLERYDNGEAILETDRFQFWQELFPKKISVMLTKQLTLREILRLFCRSTGAKLCVTRRGLIRPYYISDAGDPTQGFLLRHKIEATDIDGDPKLGWNEVFNRVQAKYGWADSRQDYLVKNVTRVDLQSIAAHRPDIDVTDVADEQEGAITDEREMPFVNDPDDVIATIDEEIVRYRYRPEYVTMVTDMYGLNVDIGDLSLYSHFDKVSSPADWRPTDEAGLTQGMVESHEIDGITRQVYVGLRDITAINGVETVDQLMLVVNDDDLAILVTNDDDEAPIVL